MLLVGLLVCTLGGFLIGAVVGVVLGRDIAIAETEKRESLHVGEVWREDLDNPEGVWKG